jgi:hypothetical protein
MGVPGGNWRYHHSSRPALACCDAMGVKVRYLVGKVFKKAIENSGPMCYNGNSERCYGGGTLPTAAL